jgi:hypothetical protein
VANIGSASLHRHFQDLADPRVERTRKHPLINVVFIAVCGILSGADSIAAIHEFALDRRTWLARYLDLTPGIPSEDTLGRVLARLDPAAFEKCLLQEKAHPPAGGSTGPSTAPEVRSAGRSGVAWAALT